MLNAQSVLNAMHAATYQQWLGYEAADITTAFQALLNTHGHSGLKATASLTMSKGVYVELSGNDISAKLQFMLSDDGPLIRVFPTSASVAAIEYNVSDMEPPIMLDLAAPDVLDLSWITKTFLNTVIQSTTVDVLDNAARKIKN